MSSHSLHSSFCNPIKPVEFSWRHTPFLPASLPGVVAPCVSRKNIPAGICYAADGSTATAPASNKSQQNDHSVSRTRAGTNGSRAKNSHSRRQRVLLYKNSNGRTATEPEPTTNSKTLPSLVVELDNTGGRRLPVGDVKVSERKWTPKWSQICEELVLGDGPRCPEDVREIKARGGTAIVSIMIDDEHERLGIDWAAVSRMASSLEIIAVKISMDEHFYQDQATALPEAVRMVASLASNGGKVYLSDASGLERGSLVALSYLTFAKATDLRKAMRIIVDAFPSANPNMAAWEETKNKLLAGESKKLATFAQNLAREKKQSGAPGSMGENWLSAKRLVIAENFKEGVTSQIQLTDKLSQISYWKARKEFTAELDRIKMLAAEKTREVLTAREDVTVAQQHISLLSNRIEGLVREANVADISMNKLVENNHELSLEVAHFLDERVIAEGSLRETIFMFKTKIEEAEERERSAIQRAETVEIEINHLAETVKQLCLRESKAVEIATVVTNISSKVANELSHRQTEISAQEETNLRITEVLKELGESKEPEGVPLSFQDSSVTQSLVDLRTTVGELVKQVMEQQDFLSASESARRETHEQVARLKQELNVIETGSTSLSDTRIPELEKQLMGLRDELVTAVEKIEDLEEEKGTYRETLTTLRIDVENETAEHELELEKISMEHVQQMEKTTLYYQAEIAEVAAELSAVTSHGKGLVDELQGAREYIRHLADELDRLHKASEEESEVREQQIHEELKFLKQAQDHVDSMTEEKIGLEHQKLLLQKAVLISIGIAIAGPAVVMTLFGHHDPEAQKIVPVTEFDQETNVAGKIDSSLKIEDDFAIGSPPLFSGGQGTVESGKDKLRKILRKQNTPGVDMVNKIDRELAALNDDLLELQKYSSSL